MDQFKKTIRKNRLVFLSGIIFIFLSAGLVYFFSDYGKHIAAGDHKENLQILANEKALDIDIFLEAQKDKLAFIGSVDVFRELILDQKDPEKIEAARSQLNEFKGVISGIRILDNNGIVIIADADLPGTGYGNKSYFALDRKKATFDRYYDPLRKADYYAVIGPIYDKAEKNRIIGAVFFDIEMDKIGALMKEASEDEDSEVYLVDKNSLLLSGSRFLEKDGKKGILVQEIKSEGVRECLEDLKKYQENGIVKAHEEEIPGYLNYMGDEVFGAHAYSLSIMGCVIAEEGVDSVISFSLTDYIKSILKKEKENED